MYSQTEQTNLAKIVCNLQIPTQAYSGKKFHKNNDNASVIGAGGLIFDLSNNKILVVKGPEKWSLPKGHLEIGEKPHEAAMREIFEETSLQIEICPTGHSKKIRRYVYYYIILDEANKLTLTPLDSKEISEVKWCSQNELTKMDCNKQLQYFIGRWKPTLKFFYDNQKNLSLKGNVPSIDELIDLQKKFTKPDLLYYDSNISKKYGANKNLMEFKSNKNE